MDPCIIVHRSVPKKQQQRSPSPAKANKTAVKREHRQNSHSTSVKASSKNKKPCIVSSSAAVTVSTSAIPKIGRPQQVTTLSNRNLGSIPSVVPVQKSSTMASGGGAAMPPPPPPKTHKCHKLQLCPPLQRMLL